MLPENFIFRLNLYPENFIFRLNLYIFRLKMHIFRLNLYIFRLKMDFCRDIDGFCDAQSRVFYVH